MALNAGILLFTGAVTLVCQACTGKHDFCFKYFGIKGWNQRDIITL